MLACDKINEQSETLRKQMFSFHLETLTTLNSLNKTTQILYESLIIKISENDSMDRIFSFRSQILGRNINN